VSGHDVPPWRRDRPASVFDPMLQHERTALAWERTAIATMVAGLLLARLAARHEVALSGFGVAWVTVGAGLLVWSGQHYEDLHGVLRSGVSPVHPTAVRVVGLTTTVFTGIASVVAFVLLLE
jgi:uncharacterized membrane protein YidH (DUF202 family)